MLCLNTLLRFENFKLISPVFTHGFLIGLDILNSERKARVFSKFAVKQDTIPVTPHLLYPQFMNENDPEDRERALFFGLVLLGKCDQIWVFGSQITKGMAREIRKAQAKGIRVRYFTEDCKEVYHGPRT